jgi:uncharacterized protein (DUF433 family)
MLIPKGRRAPTPQAIEGRRRICDSAASGRRFGPRGGMATANTEFWRERLSVPAYGVAEAARYARTSQGTIGNWEKIKGRRRSVVTSRRFRESLSYLQLIEVGVVAAMRKSNVKLRIISEAREYLCKEFNTQYPFAHYRFKTDGKKLFMAYDQIVPADKDKLLGVNEQGQLAWNQILAGLLQEFEYDTDIATVLRWKVAGVDSPIRLDPRVAFGAPHVSGIATWVLRDRWKSGENAADIAEDYELPLQLVTVALHFENIEVDPDRPRKWTH